MNTRPQIVLASVLRVMQPLARLLLRSGITYPVFAAALKKVFLDAARSELRSLGMAQTDSAVTLLSGVHRRDVRQLSRGTERAGAGPAAEPLSLVGQVVARWLVEPRWQDAQDRPRGLARGDAAQGFDALVASVSRDVRPRAMLDDMLRLGVVREEEGTVHLQADGFAPRQGLAEMATLFADNLQDHAAAAAANLHGDGRFLEQAVYVDQITQTSAEQLRRTATRAWQQAFKTVMQEAQTRFDDDAAQAEPTQRRQRARFGVYFYSEPEDRT
jgi:Family of unknown function (DUF6502)